MNSICQVCQISQICKVTTTNNDIVEFLKVRSHEGSTNAKSVKFFSRNTCTTEWSRNSIEFSKFS